MDTPRLSHLSFDEHKEHSDLMARQANRNTTSVEGLFIETDVRVRICHCSYIIQLFSLFAGWKCIICPSVLNH